ncbi:MAG: peroxiredoxin [Alphaproteobacteria bacterium]|jgi:glutaredoxin/glutathione-dependent peroxiredoxin|nr:peroxiredoxin [Alphaproteobacteria bacterium]MBT4083403.1 peroxiredoxin [Alphaproteobacteria bacterium]MBT4542945.1 peroxiredoxin [Alphaproteobacteria bacterium]MBT5920269.1 peroxiredoxin [Alphaproteobacteria bacterium]MBT6384473.1 peroxiredoxin [Alphaproteobacteria bacterium]
MTIQVGDKIPDITLTTMTAEGPAPVTSADLFGGKKVVLFAVPGAFTPTCSAKHLPGFVGNADAIKAKGVDTVACLSVNDPFVMGAWGKDQNVGSNVMMLADGAAAFNTAMGLDWDLSAKGLGVRSQRYVMVIDDGTVTHLAVEEAGAFDVSSAESVLSVL